jgi:hypothetical protein
MSSRNRTSAVKASKATKAVTAKPAKKLMTHAQRSQASRIAARDAWSFMNSKPYQAIKNSNRTHAQKRAAIEKLKASR